MNINFRFIEIIISIIIWAISNTFFLFNFIKAGQSAGNPQARADLDSELLFISIFNFLSVITLIILKFRFWYISLIFSVFTAYMLSKVLLISMLIIEAIKDFFKSKKIKSQNNLNKEDKL